MSNPNPPETRDCRDAHTGEWLAEPRWMRRMVSAYQSGNLPIQAQAVEGESDDRLMSRTEDGIAIIPISGPMMKGDSKFGGASTLRIRRAIRESVADPATKAILFSVDSPGGTVAGTDALAQDIANATRSIPVHTFGSDLVASAAVWAVSQTDRITIERTTEIGSIGVVAVVEDTSEMAEMMGVKVHVVSTGDAKGDFAPGVEVTDEMLARLQSRVNEINDFFMRSVARGRKIALDDVRKIATGETFMAAKGVEVGLADEVGSFDDALSALRREMRARRRAAESRRRGQQQRAAMLRLSE